MPLVNIDVIRGRDEHQLNALLDGVHDAMVEAFQVPPTDRYQILTQHEPKEMIALDTGLGLTRSSDLVVLHFISRQRTPEAKTALYRLLARNLQANCRISLEDLIVTITENDAADWSFGQGIAQFLTADL